MWISRQTREPGCLYTGRKRGVYLSGEHNKRNTIRLRRALPRRLGRTSIYLLFSLPFNTSVNYWLVHGTTRIFIRLGRKSLSLSSLAVQGVSIYIAFDIVLDLPSRCYSTESQKNFFFSTDFFLNFENIFFSLLHSPPHSVISIFFVLFSKQCCWIRTAHRFFPELRVSISSTDFCSPAPPLNFSSVQNHCLPLLLLAFWQCKHFVKIKNKTRNEADRE